MLPAIGKKARLRFLPVRYPPAIFADLNQVLYDEAAVIPRMRPTSLDPLLNARFLAYDFWPYKYMAICVHKG